MTTEVNPARATTFVEEASGHNTVEVIILTRPSSTGLCKVRRADATTPGSEERIPFVRHVSKLSPLNEEARIMLGRT